jgi:hypothetical protein
MITGRKMLHKKPTVDIWIVENKTSMRNFFEYSSTATRGIPSTASDGKPLRLLFSVLIELQRGLETDFLIPSVSAVTYLQQL